jgi:hypothetical protein
MDYTQCVDICRQISSNLQTVLYVLNPDKSLGSVLRIPMVVLTIMNKMNGLRQTRQRLWLQLLGFIVWGYEQVSGRDCRRSVGLSSGAEETAAGKPGRK